MCFIPLAVSYHNTCKVCLPEKFISDSVSRIFPGGWSHGHPLTSMYQNFRFLEGKQMFSTNHTNDHGSQT